MCAIATSSDNPVLQAAQTSRASASSTNQWHWCRPPLVRTRHPGVPSCSDAQTDHRGRMPPRLATDFVTPLRDAGGVRGVARQFEQFVDAPVRVDHALVDGALEGIEREG